MRVYLFFSIPPVYELPDDEVWEGSHRCLLLASPNCALVFRRRELPLFALSGPGPFCGSWSSWLFLDYGCGKPDILAFCALYLISYQHVGCVRLSPYEPVSSGEAGTLSQGNPDLRTGCASQACSQLCAWEGVWTEQCKGEPLRSRQVCEWICEGEQGGHTWVRRSVRHWENGRANGQVVSGTLTGVWKSEKGRWPPAVWAEGMLVQAGVHVLGSWVGRVGCLLL